MFVRSIGPTLVLREFVLDEYTRSGTYVQIVGRAPGLVAYVLTAMGIDAETTLTVGDSDIFLRSASLCGETHQVIPLSSVASTHCGYQKPIGFVFVGILFAVLGLIAGSFAATAFLLAIGAICVLLYFLRKNLTITVETNGGLIIGLRFRPSVIEGVAVAMDRSLRTIRLINRQVILSRGGVVPA